MKAKRTTDASQREQSRKEALRKKDADLFKATIKQKKSDARKQAASAEADDDDSDWESVEEDFPHVQLSELLDGLKLEVNNPDDEDEDE